MINLGPLTILNFGCIKKATIQLTAQGLVLVLGENYDTTSADSNGSGKSTLFKALSWCLFGRTVDGLKGDAVIRSGAKKTEVTLQPTIDGVEYTFTRTKGRGKSERLGLYYSEEHKALGERTLKGAQEMLERLIGLDWLAFTNTVLYGQGDILHFADPRTTDTARKSVLTRVLRLERLDIGRAEARKRRKATDEEMGRLERVLVAADARLGALNEVDLESEVTRWAESQTENIEDQQEAVEGIETDLGALSKARRSLKAYEKRADDVLMVLDDYKATRTRRRELKDEEIEAVGVLARLTASRGSATRHCEKCEEAVEELEAGNCPTCGTESDAPSVQAKLGELREDVEEAEGSLEQIGEQMEAARLERGGLSDAIVDIDIELEEESDWKDRADQLAAGIAGFRKQLESEPVLTRRLGAAKRRLEEMEAEPNPFAERAGDHEAEIEALEVEITDNKTLLKAETERRRLLDFWVEGFGPGGLPSYLMDSVVPIVAERANHYLETLADGDLKIKLDTQTLLKSGGVRERFTLTATVEGQTDVALSGGQLKKTTLACDLALMDLVASREGAGLDLLLLDEVLDGLDAAGKARVMDLLELLAARRSTVIVISHDPAIVEKFTKTIVVEKRDGIARLK